MTSTSPSTIQVLAVDDDQSFVDLTAQRLALELDYDEVDIITETDAEIALDRIDDDIDCIVSDYQMPGMDGLEFLDAVRTHCPELPFILFTGKGSEEIASDAISAGVTDYVQKNPSGDQYLMLANRIETAVEGYRAQQARSAAEERYRQLVEQTSHAIAVCQDAEITYANEAFTDLLNADAQQDIIGLPLTEVIHPDFQGEYMSQIEGIQNQDSIDWLQGEVCTFDGDTRLVETTGAPVTYNGESAVQLIFRDIIERTHREHELERTTEWFRSVFEHSHDPMLILDPAENTFHDANSRACELLGYSRDELLSVTPEDVHPHDLDQFRVFMDSVVAERTGWTRELSCYTKDGSTVPVEVSASVIETNGNQRVLAVLRDLNAREIREQQLRQLQEVATELLAAESRTKVEQLTVEAIKEILELPYAGFSRFDPESENLELTVVSSAVEDIFDGDVPSLDAENDALAWETYTSGESQIIQDLEQAGSEITDEMPIKSSIQFPVGEDGVLLIGAPTTNAFDPSEIDLARLLATTVDAAMDRLAREQELALKERAMDEADIGILITDPTQPDNPIIYANEGFEQLTGYTEAEILGDNCRFLQGEETDSETVATMREAINAEEPVSVEVLNYRKDGTPFWNRVEITPVRDHDGAVTHFLGFQREVTERKERERELELFRNLLDYSTDEIYILAPETGQFLDVNDTACRHLGYDQDELCTMTVDDIDASGFTDQWDERIDRLRSQESIGEQMFYERHERKDGSTYPVEINANCVVMDGEEYVLATARDLTERQEREQQIRAQQRRLDAILTNVPIILWEIDADGIFTQSEGQALQRLGLEPGEVVGDSVFDVFADHPGIRDHCERALDGESIATLVEVDDTVFESWYEPLQTDGGEVAGVVGLSYDITEQKEREQELQRLKQRFQAVFEQSNDAIMVVDMEDEEFIEVNEAACEMLDYSREELLALHPEDIHPDDIDQVREEFLSDVYETGSGWTDELSCVTKHGDEVPTEISGATLRIDEERDQPSKMVAILRDVSERVAYEQELERQNERLENFASIVSHDLRSPLTLAEGYLKLLRETGDEEALDKMETAHERMQTIINDVLTVARDGQTVEEVEPVDFPELVEAAWDGVEIRDATLRTESIPDTIMGDEVRLQRVFENLFRNAIDHAGEDVTVTVGSLSGGQGVYVADDGPGIPEDEREEVFEWGYSTAEDGTGYGLSIVNDLIEAHGWTVTITESESGGVRFEITGIKLEKALPENPVS